jgi:hypothetical protein
MKKLSLRTLALGLVVLLAGMMSTLVLRAQSAPPRKEHRVLLIFETSSAMKKRVPSEVKSIKRLFALSLAEQLHRGDSVGAWTFGRDLSAGQFPLQYWQPEDITYITSNLIEYVEAQHYSGPGDFDKMVPRLNQIIKNSGQLTTLIFCDGETPINGTAYDSSINSVFKDHAHQMEKLREAFVIVLKTEDGKVLSSTINAAEAINVPAFAEPLPVPPVPIYAPSTPEPAPPAPVSTAAPLIVIGTKTETNLPPPEPASTPPPITTPAPPAPAAPVPTPPPSDIVVISNPPPKIVAAPPVTTPVVQTNVVAPPPPPPPPAPPVIQSTAPVMATPETPPSNKRMLLGIGIGILLVAGIATFLMRRSRRQPSGSLITESLKKR